MGIHGLLPFLKPFVHRSNIKNLRGKTVGVDAMCWMHKGAFACSQELVLGQDTDKFVHYFLRMCETLRFHEIKPVIVFDGARLPAKAKEEGQRMEVRETARQEALQLFQRKRSGEHVDERVLASKCEAAIKITTDMISRLMSALRELSIHFIVAPFEADAQLAYMCRLGWVHSVISEDSDLLAYGCPNTFFKMDRYGEGEHIALPCLQPEAAAASKECDSKAEAKPAGEATEVEDAAKGDEVIDEEEANKENAAANQGSGRAGHSGKTGRGRGRGRGRARKAVPTGEEHDAVEDAADGAEDVLEGRAGGEARAPVLKDAPITELAKWTPERFVEFCVLCGTDYKEHDVHIKGLGVKTAFKFLCNFRSVDAMIRWMALDKKWKEKLSCTKEEYLKRFQNVVAVFWHHLVFDPRRGECVSIANSFPASTRELPGLDLRALCGVAVSKDIAKRVARGEVDARTHEARSQAPLTPAERMALDRILAQKRTEQRQHEFDQLLRADAKRAAEARAAEQLRSSQPALPDAQQQSACSSKVQGAPPVAPPVAAPTSGGDAAAAQEEPHLEESAPREMCLLPGDIAAILAVKEEVLGQRGRQESPDDGAGGEQVHEADGGAAESSVTPPRLPAAAQAETPSNPAHANPFARKRAAGPGSIGSSVLPKRPRVFGVTTAQTPQGIGAVGRVGAGPRTAATGGSGGAQESPRRMVQPEAHPRGGFAAQDAASAVLAQRGMPELERLPENKDRGKLTSFFRVKMPEKKGDRVEKVESAKTKGGGLASWRPRPWEAAEDDHTDPFTVGKNALSLQRPVWRALH